MIRALCIVNISTLTGVESVIKKLDLHKCTNHHNICAGDDYTLDHMYTLYNKRSIIFSFEQEI